MWIEYELLVDDAAVGTYWQRTRMPNGPRYRIFLVHDAIVDWHVGVNTRASLSMWHAALARLD